MQVTTFSAERLVLSAIRPPAPSPGLRPAPRPLVSVMVRASPLSGGMGRRRGRSGTERDGEADDGQEDAGGPALPAQPGRPRVQERSDARRGEDDGRVDRAALADLDAAEQ